jgi:hypothetical protein
VRGVAPVVEEGRVVRGLPGGELGQLAQQLIEPEAGLAQVGDDLARR